MSRQTSINNNDSTVITTSTQPTITTTTTNSTSNSSHPSSLLANNDRTGMKFYWGNFTFEFDSLNYSNKLLSFRSDY
jgi:hypothetical protein